MNYFLNVAIHLTPKGSGISGEVRLNLNSSCNRFPTYFDEFNSKRIFNAVDYHGAMFYIPSDILCEEIKRPENKFLTPQ